MNRLRKTRQEKKLTLKEVSEQLNKKGFEITPDSLAKYERGNREPKLETWQKLADFFGVTVAYLLSQGIPIKIISKRLGHSRVTVTLNVYSYLIDEFKAQNDDLILQKLSQL